jgi:hypothetical protein
VAVRGAAGDFASAGGVVLVTDAGVRHGAVVVAALTQANARDADALGESGGHILHVIASRWRVVKGVSL